MSSYMFKAKLRSTGQIYDVFAIDDMYGRHNYGYRVEGTDYPEDAFNKLYETFESPAVLSAEEIEKTIKKLNTSSKYETFESPAVLLHTGNATGGVLEIIKSGELEKAAHDFIEEQSAGEWGDKAIEEDTVKLVEFVKKWHTRVTIEPAVLLHERPTLMNDDGSWAAGGLAMIDAIIKVTKWADTPLNRNLAHLIALEIMELCGVAVPLHKVSRVELAEMLLEAHIAIDELFSDLINLSPNAMPFFPTKSKQWPTLLKLTEMMKTLGVSR